MDKFNLIQQTDIFFERLKLLSENLNSLYSSNSSVLETDILNSYSDIINAFSESLDKSIIGSLDKIPMGSLPEPGKQNLIFSALGKDLNILFAEISALDKLIVSSFNSLNLESNSIIQKIKSNANILGDYLLYADPTLGAGYFFGDSFSSSEKIDIGSSLVDGDECYLSQEEGIVLLPLNGEPERYKVKSIIINKNSNGISGSNYQVDVFGHNDISVIGDGEPNTWFEYERVTQTESSLPLILDLTISLEKLVVVNHIHINPMNFGVPIPIKIKTLETSKDGKEYVSIKDEIPIVDFIPEVESKDFSLSSSTSKFSGQGFYSFIPRKVQYVHIVFEQQNPYTIKTLNGEKLRYAIGLRDINILGRKFKDKGSLVSTSFTSARDAKKISLWVSENPVEKSTLADIDHFVSIDNGGTWNQIQSQQRSSFTVPEILNFNNIENNSINTGTEVKNFRHKISLFRNKNNFKGNVNLKQEVVTDTETISIPDFSSRSISLKQETIKESIGILQPFYGSFSCPRPNTGSDILGKSTIGNLDYVEFMVDLPSSTGTIRYQLPYEDIDNLVEKIRVFVNGEQWEYVGKITDEDEDSKVYFLNKNGKEIQFGKDSKGMIPSQGSKIQICLDGDNPSLEITDKGYIINLSKPCDGLKENVSIIAFEDDGWKTEKIRVTSDSLMIKFNKFGNVENKSLIDPKLFDEITDITDKSLFFGSFKKTSKENKSSHKVTVFDTLSSSKRLNDYLVSKDPEGFLIPCYDSDFEIEEYPPQSSIPYPLSEKLYKNKVDFIDGKTELIGEGYCSFDSKNGIVYFNPPVPNNRIVYVTVYRKKTKLIDGSVWKFDENTYKKIDTQRIILDPKYVYTFSKKIDISEGSRSSQLVEKQTSHSFETQKIVKGSVILNGDIFGIGKKTLEVPFVDGFIELNNTVTVGEELISFTSEGSNIYSYQLKNISIDNELNVGSVAVSSIRLTTSLTTPINQFDSSQTVGDLETNGNWKVEIDNDGNAFIKIYYDGELSDYIVSYTYQVIDSGIDTSALYSIDYKNGIIYFSVPTSQSGSVTFETSMYSTFYNITKKVEDYEIESISDNGIDIKFTESFVMKFLKQDNVQKSRPQFLKAIYKYYKKSTESLEDLEPYFSPICKDIAFRVVTSDMFGDL